MDSVKITLIANAGVIIEYRDQQLLIDALHEGHRFYQGTPPEAMQALLDGQPPFKSIKALVVTHNHADHFSTRFTLPVLQRYRDAEFIADESSAEALRQAYQNEGEPFDDSRIQVMPWSLPNAEERATSTYERVLPARIETGPFTIQPIPFEHEGHRYIGFPNIGLMITVAGLNILNPGDARMSAENFAILASHLPPIDVAIVMFPYIATSRGQNLVRDVIRPRSLIAVHWPDPERDQEHLNEHAARFFERNKDSMMQTWFLKRYLDSVSFNEIPINAI